MHIHRSIDNIPKFNNAVVTIGSFDGVHRGHQKIIQRIIGLAKKINGESVLITFHPHPRKIIYPKDNTLQLLTTIEEKLLLFEKNGLDHVVIVPFSIEFSQQSPREYLDKFIMSNFSPSYIVIGYDHRFGLNRGGDIHLLQNYAKENNFEVLEIQKQEIEDIAISSTKIRNALLEGDIINANMFLAYPYTLTGTVIHGDKIGKQLGYPTANLSVYEKEKLIPKLGVYAVNINVKGIKYEGMLYIGNRPTINTKQTTSLEVNIFDFDDDIYDEKIEVELVDYVRGDEKFESADELRDQLAKDKISSLKILSALKYTHSHKKKVSIAILNFNGVEHLESYLPSVVSACPEEGEVVVIDNNSTDDSISFLEDWYPEIKIISLPQNLGFAAGYNKGLERINSPLTFILNSDVSLEKESVTLLVKKISSDIKIAALQPTILSIEEKNKYEYAGAAGGMIDYLGYPFCQGRVFDSIEEHHSQYSSGEIFWASGAAMMVRTEIFKKLGGFDADYFAHQEEIDFCWRCKRAGYKIEYLSDAKVYHLGGGTLAYESTKKTYLNFRNNLLTLIKNLPLSTLLYLLPLRFILDGVAGIRFIVAGKIKSAFAIVKAHWSVIINIRKYFTKKVAYNRLISTHSIGEYNKAGILNKSIVWQYYVKSIRKASQIIK